MFVLINKDTFKKGSFHQTLDEAKQKLQKLGSISSKYYIVDIKDESYENFDVSKATQVE